MTGSKIPINRALTLILLSTITVSGCAALGWFYLLHWRHERSEDVRFTLCSLAQVCEEGPELEDNYLTELMGLSVDYPVNLYNLDLGEMKHRLTVSPHLRSVKLKRIHPNMLQVRYRSRRPIAYLTDYVNVAVDADFVPFPAHPFMTPKRLPAIYMGLLGEAEWNVALKGRQVELAKELLQFLEKEEGLRIELIDLSRIENPLYGRREVIVAYTDLFNNKQLPRLMRLHTSCYISQIQSFKELRHQMLFHWSIEEQPYLIDLRTPHIALCEGSAGREQAATAYRSALGAVWSTTACNP